MFVIGENTWNEEEEFNMGTSEMNEEEPTKRVTGK